VNKLKLYHGLKVNVYNKRSSLYRSIWNWYPYRIYSYDVIL